MPLPSPFHARTAPLCTSQRWKDWAGYLAVCRFDHCHEKEYFAFREAAGLIDVTPLYKYEVHGPDARRLLARMMVRDIGKLAVGRVTYCCWCDDDGRMLDDGTVTRLDEDYYRVTAADPTFHWLQRLARGLSVTIEDSSAKLAALALQGPNAREILRACCDADLDELKFFRVTRARMDELAVWITRTGYTGDLGYEVWVENDSATRLWDILVHAGADWGLLPAGLDALDMTRIEAGFIMLGVDYFSSAHVIPDELKSTPFEAGLGWCVNLERDPFVGQRALVAEQQRGPAWQLRGLEMDWDVLRELYDRHGLPPNVPAEACRDALPVYQGGVQVGQATSNTFSPILKKFIALASIRSRWAQPGTELEIEHTVAYERCRVKATVVETPFFNPERKRRP
ncbi:MAG: aminomethyltransferase family protein [Gammaproteobacteria bacterium]|nr:aminomethyltransferase family protein [Gammaproteobacteria bacterium]